MESIVEELIEMLEDYGDNLGEGTYDPYYGRTLIVDKLCSLRENLWKDGTYNGRRYDSFFVITDKPVIKLYEEVEVQMLLSKKKRTVKVMEIQEVKPVKDGKYEVTFLGIRTVGDENGKRVEHRMS